MKFNVGTPDRIVRLIIGVLLLLAPFFTEWAMFADPIWTWVFVIAGAVLVVTGVVRVCPAYALLNLSTARSNDR